MIARRWVAMVVGGVSFLLLANDPVSAQQGARGMPGNAGMNQNIYANPYATRTQYPNTAVLGQGLQNGAAFTPSFSPAQGYGMLTTSPGSAGAGSYGSLISSSSSSGGYGGYGGYGGWGGYSPFLGLGQNVYQGYLDGAANVTNANAQYQLTIQQAKLVRQEAIRSAMDTRRKMIEEAEYERSIMPDPEKIRQANLKRELDHARVDPPLTEMASGEALNILLRQLIKMQGRGERGPNVPLSEDTLKWINLTTGDSRANPGLLKDNGALQWPATLLDPKFKEAREDLNRRLKEAVNAVKVNREADQGTLNDLRAGLTTLNDTLENNVNTLSPAQYIDARRYLNLVGNAIKALEDHNVSELLNGNWLARSKNVADLVKFMSDKGLQFAPAAPGEEPAYRALYYALAAFDANLPR